MYNIKNCSIPDHFFKDPETGYCLECIELLAAKVQEEYSAKDEIFVLNSIKNPTKTLARQFKYPEALVIADKAIQFFSQAEEIYFDLGDDLKRRNSYFEIRNRKKQNEAIENCYYEGRLLAGVLANLLEQKCIILLLIIYPLDIMNLYQETEAFKFAYQAMRKYLYVNEGLEHQQREEQLTQEQMLLELINYHNLIISQNKDTIMNFQMKSIDIINEVWPYKMILKMQKIKQLAKEDEAYECCEVGLIKYPKNKMYDSISLFHFPDIVKQLKYEKALELIDILLSIDPECQKYIMGKGPLLYYFRNLLREEQLMYKIEGLGEKAKALEYYNQGAQKQEAQYFQEMMKQLQNLCYEVNIIDIQKPTEKSSEAFQSEFYRLPVFFPHDAQAFEQNEEAIEQYDKHLLQQPQNKTIWLCKGQALVLNYFKFCLWRVGRYQEAIDCCDQGLMIDSYDSDSYTMKYTKNRFQQIQIEIQVKKIREGCIIKQLNREEEAFNVLEEMNKKIVNCYFCLIELSNLIEQKKQNCIASKKRYVESLEKLQQTLTLNLQSSEAHFRISFFLIKIGCVLEYFLLQYQKYLKLNNTKKLYFMLIKPLFLKMIKQTNLGIIMQKVNVNMNFKGRILTLKLKLTMLFNLYQNEEAKYCFEKARLLGLDPMHCSDFEEEINRQLKNAK